MAIAVGTNSTTSPRQSVSLASISVSAYDAGDIIESMATVKTPFVANTSITSDPVNQFSPAPVAYTTTLVSAYNQADLIESASITKTPFTLQVPYAWSTIVTGGYSGVDIVITEYADEYWVTQ